jgi:hypothetical protein
MNRIVVYSPFTSTRLRYVAEWLFKERLHLNYTLVHTLAEAQAATHVVAYGIPMPDAISIPASGLLSATDITAQQPAIGKWQSVPTLYADDADGYTLPFDLFSAIFFLLTRYEEYEVYMPDKHGRYPAVNSILYQQGWLQRPIVDEWIHALRIALQDHYNTTLPASTFVFLPTYDIDMAYAHLHKGARRIVGAMFRALIRADLRQISLRAKVLQKKEKDPYDSFRWLRQLHKQYGLAPLYFVLSTRRTTAFDKNIHPQHPAMVRVIKNLVKDGNIGIHPSYYAHKGDTLRQEKMILEQVSGKRTSISRQHYIRAIIPETYHQLMHNHITQDYSMGYGTHLGFRAGTGSSFLWYDLEHDVATQLRIFPFCFMDTTAQYEVKLTATEAMERLQAMTRILQRTGSTLITVYHNFSLGTDEGWKGWRNAYEQFVESVTHDRISTTENKVLL